MDYNFILKNATKHLHMMDKTMTDIDERAYREKQQAFELATKFTGLDTCKMTYDDFSKIVDLVKENTKNGEECDVRLPVWIAKAVLDFSIKICDEDKEKISKFIDMSTKIIEEHIMKMEINDAAKALCNALDEKSRKGHMTVKRNIPDEDDGLNEESNN